MMSLGRLVLACAAVVFATAARVQASTIAYDESVNGDLPSASITDLGSVGIGLNTVDGTASGSPSFDRDTFQFTVPFGVQVTDISIVANEENGSFFTLRFDLFEGSGFGGLNLENVLLAGSGADSDGFTATPLDAGVYTIGQNQISSGDVMDYNVSISGASVSTVPEPSSLASLVGIGACFAGLGVTRRRQRHGKHRINPSTV